jgi:N-acetylglucosamine-6-phosphate deacetylase
LPNATVVINGDNIERVSMGKQTPPSRQTDPTVEIYFAGHIDTHVHFSIGGFVYPTGRRRLTAFAHTKMKCGVKSHLGTFARYIRCNQRGRRADQCEFRRPQDSQRDCESAASPWPGR